MTTITAILRRLSEAEDAVTWPQVRAALDELSLDELIELDLRVQLGPRDLTDAEPRTLRRRVVDHVLQRKLRAFLYECFDPYVNPWLLEERMKALFWRMEFVRSLADQLEEVAEAHKRDPDLPWTVNGNLFGMANSALLAWHLGAWDQNAPAYAQGVLPPALDFRGDAEPTSDSPVDAVSGAHADPASRPRARSAASGRPPAETPRPAADSG
jgi:hypothetical protein